MFCAQCNKEFDKSFHYRKYCSKTCSSEAVKKYLKKYLKTKKYKLYVMKYQSSEKGKAARKRANDAQWADPKKREKKIKIFKAWSNKTNTKNIKDETGRLLTNMEVRNRTLKAGKKKE